MTTLYVDTTARYQNVATNDLASRILIENGDPVIYRPISETTVAFAKAWPEACFSPPQYLTSADRDALEMGEIVAAEFFAANNFVINVPLAGGQIPKAFKAWVELVSFSDQDRTTGFEDKSATLIVAAGGLKAGSEREDLTSYLTSHLEFIGITDVTIIAADQTTPPASQMPIEEHSLALAA